MYSYHSVLECYKMFSGVKLSINKIVLFYLFVKNEAYNIKIKFRVGGNLKIFCFCMSANTAASDKGISLKRKILEKVL